MLLEENFEVVEQQVTTEVVDLLDRKAFIDQLIEVINMLAVNKKSVCFALNGSWGIGKSFVLKMLEDQIVNIQTEESTFGKYMLFHYDCWKYDYYDEPLIAIVAALLDAIDNQVHLLSDEKRTRIKSFLKVIGVKLADKINVKIEDKIGVDVRQLWNTYQDIDDEVAKKITDNHAFDRFFEFNKTLSELRKLLESLANDQTLIFVVDEMDRCLPEYTIKTLERLHHIFDGIPNVQVVLSIDKGQLEHTVKQIYGLDTDVKKYLEKFISFDISLPVGSLNDQADSFFKNYYLQFDNTDKVVNSDELIEFKSLILQGINTRSRIAIIDKCSLIHKLLVREDKKMDSIFLCIEMMLTVLKFYDLDIIKAKEKFDMNNLFEADVTCTGKTNNHILLGLKLIREKFRKKPGGHMDSNFSFLGSRYLLRTPNGSVFIMCDDIWGILLACYRAILGFDQDNWSFNGKPIEEAIRQHTLDYWRLLKTIA